MRSSLTIACALSIGAAALASMTGACSGDEQASGGKGTSGAGGGAGGSGSTMAGGGGDIFGSTSSGMSDGGLDPDAACAASSAEATLTKKPVDIIFIIDNSGSMTGEIQAVQSNINSSFATIIGASGIDYRVIMVSMHGNAVGAQSICVQSPLSTTNCSPIPAQPGENPPTFFQYSIEIGSHNSVCQLFNSYNGTVKDVFGLAPTGWSTWARPEALKVFVEITDDGVGSCTVNGKAIDDNDNEANGLTAAAAFDAELLALDPAQFGDANKRNYIWHSIVGLTSNNPPTAAYGPMDPVVNGVCSGAVAPGQGYQALSIMTGGLRFPVCENASFDVVFQEIAKGVVEGAKVDCEFPVPPAPPGETIDISTVVVEYTPGGGGAPQQFKQVASAAACAADSFYIENNIIKLCAGPCGVVQSDPMAKVIVLYGCENMVQ